MEFTNNKKYKKGKTFTQRELLKLTPQHVYNYMSFKVYGKLNATVNDTPKIRHETLEYHKKSISYFMPSSQEWDPRHKTGNPTKSKMVAGIIKVLKLKQVRKQGAPSQARRPLLTHEFNKLIELVRLEKSSEKCYGMKAYLLFQYHMIARVDDVAHMRFDYLKPHPEYSFEHPIR